MGRLQCRECLSTNIVHDGDTVACAECGSVLEQSQIVSEVTFGETSSGAATVQGSYVGADQAGARISGPGGFRGSSAGESRQQTLANALQNIRKMANIWNLSESVILMAHRIFTLAMVGGGEWLREHSDPSNFVLGRKSDITVASCLYLACRYENRPLMLIDFADSIGENVFTLGRSYLKLTRMIHMKPPRGVDGASTIVDPSIYIQRFAIMLDFGDEAPKVTSDALRLIKRFKADWMVQGRRPAGLCAAALILAARMNHFRRSIAEVVQVARIADVTLRKRLDEFAKTESSKLSVADFRSLWLENAQDPPAFYEPIEAAKKRKLKVEIEGAEDAADGEGDDAEGQGSPRKRRKTAKGKGKAKATDDAEDADDEGDAALNGVDAAVGARRNQSTSGQQQDGLEEPETLEQALQRQRQLETEAAFDRMAEADVAELLRGPELRQTAEELEAEEAARIARARAVPSAAAAAAAAATLREITMNDIDPRLRSDQDEAGPFDRAEASSEPDDRHSDVDQAAQAKNGQATAEKEEQADPSAVRAAPAKDQDAAEEEHESAPRDKEEDGEDRESNGSDSSIEDLDPTRIYFPRVRKRSMSAPIMPEDELIGLDEEELDMYIATDAEVKIKERVWIEFNRDYLERELNKQLKIELMEKQGIPAIKREQRKRKPRDSSTPMASTAAEATQKMMQQNKKFSRKLNYDILNAMFDPSKVGSSKGAGKGKQRSSRQHAPQSDEDDDDDEDEDDEDDGEDGPSRRALQIPGGMIYENGEVADLANSSSSRKTRVMRNKPSGKGSSDRHRRSSVGGRSSGAETDGATTDGGEATDPMAAEYRRMVRGNFQADEGGYVEDEW
ncbi:transcription factor TFIIIB subunit brf1 [Tilletia horrida]|nr:transcription factor TFIIIB subunit brf1 [Tilletia horrida]